MIDLAGGLASARLVRARGPMRIMEIAGAIVVIAMFAACVLTLPYTLGRPPAEPRANGASAGSIGTDGVREQAPRRYEATDLERPLLPPFWARHAPDELERLQRGSDERHPPPRHWLGTDKLGRDLLVRCLAGGGISLTIGLAAAAISVLIGTLFGTLAGYVGGRLDALLMRFVDVLYGLPYILLVVLLAVAAEGLLDRIDGSFIDAGTAAPRWLTWIHQGSGLINIITLLVAIGGVSWLTMARVIRGQVLSLKQQPFIEACRALGVGPRRLFLRHLLPNLLGPIIVYATLTVPTAILSESFLSFLGIGVHEPLPSWGNLAADGLSELNTVRIRWWLLLWPCLLIAITLLSLNFVGEGLRERYDPRRRTARGA